MPSNFVQMVRGLFQGRRDGALAINRIVGPAAWISRIFEQLAADIKRLIDIYDLSVGFRVRVSRIREGRDPDLLFDFLIFHFAESAEILCCADFGSRDCFSPESGRLFVDIGYSVSDLTEIFALCDAKLKRGPELVFRRVIDREH